jgi:hydroxylaminobenzene mutase
MQGLFLMIAGLMWPKLTFGRTTSRIAFCLLVYGCFAALAANALAGLWGAGNTLLPLAAGAAHGSTVQEMVIMVGLRTAAVALILSVILIIWGLRSSDEK